MNTAPAIDVTLHTGPTDWWEVVGALGPIAVLVAAVLALIIGMNTLRQRTTADSDALKQEQSADNRAEWWRRTQWALDRAMDVDDDTKTLGINSLQVLAGSQLAQREELELMDIAWQVVSAIRLKEEPPATADETATVVEYSQLPSSSNRRWGGFSGTSRPRPFHAKHPTKRQAKRPAKRRAATMDAGTTPRDNGKTRETEGD